jgi:hypothetical protein
MNTKTKQVKLVYVSPKADLRRSALTMEPEASLPIGYGSRKAFIPMLDAEPVE